MKKGAKFWSVMLSLAMAVPVFSLAACGGNGGGNTPEPPEPPAPPAPPPHVHTFAEDWTYDDAQHWHRATCAHTAVKDALAAHDDDGEDGACSVCGYKLEVHEHTYSETWTITESKHWRVATCEHDTLITDEGAHDEAGTDGACSVCGFKHEHTYDTAYWAFTSTEHWRQTSCGHHDDKDRGEVAAHDTLGENGKCSVCGWYEHECTYQTSLTDTKNAKKYRYFDNHWTENKCSNKACSKNYNYDAPRFKNVELHTYVDGVCTGCGFTNTWLYGDDCIVCEVCDGCIKTTCVHDGEETHKKCSDHGEGSHTYSIEAENAEVTSPMGGPGGIYDARNAKRMVVHADYYNVKFTVTANKACNVTLRVKVGKAGSKSEKFTDYGAVFVNDEQMTSNTLLAQPEDVEDLKCSTAWLTIGCIPLIEGENVIELCQVEGKTGFHLDKIDLTTASDVTLTWTDIDNTALYDDHGYWRPLPNDNATEPSEPTVPEALAALLPEENKKSFAA